jgi:hypothetical protein
LSISGKNSVAKIGRLGTNLLYRLIYDIKLPDDRPADPEPTLLPT